MRQIRQGVFETNSSSTHAISVSTGNVEIPDNYTLVFETGEFGWEHGTLESVYEKASYLYTALYTDRKEQIADVIKTLESNGVKVEISEDNDYKYCYVDHSYGLSDFLDYVLADDSNLLNYLFSPFSFIVTGNDNQDYYDVEDIAKEYSKEDSVIFYKGN